ncbi:Pr6Pr family membrane protein [Amnibacterium flavum]|uniref:Pr6Pr family membrane protein n=1 Tax=Amnibacterium flavum TaxID=2173173 RepID=A0A2V1HN66_9MICO|nr:Pr6Pr family membrane protein [Amnibacterium flavum]PVZ93988.1 hypothetical protein DDQ50_09520 [Amnibacterium flavum]
MASAAEVTTRWFDHRLIRAARIVVGVGVFGTVIANMFIVAGHPGGLDLGNYLSFFTNLSNLIAGVVFVVSGAFVRDRLPAWWDGVRGAMALYLGLAGVVFALLLQWLPSAGTITPWVNAIVHLGMPILAVLDWLLIPSIRAAPWWRPLAWLAFPLAYLVYTLIRGPIVDWYPYDFVDPRLWGGYERLVRTTGVVVLGFLAGAIVLDMLGRVRFRLAIRAERRSVAAGGSTVSVERDSVRR